MHNLIFQPFLDETLNMVLSFAFVILVLCTALSYPIKNMYVFKVLILLGSVLSFYSHSQRLSDGFSLGLLVGLAIALWGSVSLGVRSAEQKNKTL